ncbi:MAG: peptide chain release factor N(5)-glutamine methyltransferase [Endomicrobia bacterium]|nr:peptide chain release factor N(5)-glutamine methyltransferase [Endomicrobiia bacterium]
MLNSKNIYTLLQSGEEFLKANNLREPKSDAEVLLSFALKVKRSQLPLMRDQKAGEHETKLFEEYISRRAKREPAAYITGSCGFMGLEFKVNKDVLIPRPETEILVEKVLETAGKNKVESVLDLCTGSGCIAVSLSKLGDFKEIFAVDISFDALMTAKENAALNAVRNIEFLLSDMFETLENVKFDCIVSNPPYVSESEYKNLEPELKFEPETALVASGSDGFSFYKEIALKAPRYLNGGGCVFVELNANYAEEIKSIFMSAGFKDAEIINDYSHLPRVLKANL